MLIVNQPDIKHSLREVNMTTVANEFEALGKKYGLTAGQIEESIKVAAQEQAKHDSEPAVEMTSKGFTATDDWTGREDFAVSQRGNYILSATPGRFHRTGVKGPHGGEMSINLVVIEVMKSDKS